MSQFDHRQGQPDDAAKGQFKTDRKPAGKARRQENDQPTRTDKPTKRSGTDSMARDFRDGSRPQSTSKEVASQSLEQIDQQIRINELREMARDAGGGQMDDWTADDCPLDIQQAFWESVVAWETAPDSTYLELLDERQVPTPAPELLNDGELHDVLWGVIRGLAELQVFLAHTDHLSDRDLYGLLWGEIMRQPTKHVPDSELWHCELDLLGGCSREDLITLQTFYPDEWCLGDWDEAFLGPKPESKRPPYDRDRRLPKDPSSDH